MQPEARRWLFDVSEAASAAIEFLGDRDAMALRDGDMLRSAVERQFCIMGEASARLRDKYPEIFAQVRDGREMISMRDHLSHRYDKVDVEQLAAAVHQELPDVVASVEAILAGHDHG